MNKLTHGQGAALQTACLPVFSLLMQRMALASLVCALAFASVSAAHAGKTKVIEYDSGGSVEARLTELSKLRTNGTNVRIEGFCASACTLYLGLPHTCVAKAATMGFHGPTSQYPGIPLPYEAFQRVTQTMADHYPTPLRDWFMRKGRLETKGLQKFSGAELIKMGARGCS